MLAPPPGAPARVVGDARRGEPRLDANPDAPYRILEHGAGGPGARLPQPLHLLLDRSQRPALPHPANGIGNGTGKAAGALFKSLRAGGLGRGGASPDRRDLPGVDEPGAQGQLLLAARGGGHADDAARAGGGRAKKRDAGARGRQPARAPPARQADHGRAAI